MNIVTSGEQRLILRFGTDGNFDTMPENNEISNRIRSKFLNFKNLDDSLSI